MPIYYADSSALAKRYLPERGSSWVTTLLRSEVISVSALAIPEVASALGRRKNEGSITASDASEIHRTFLRHLLSYRVYDLTQQILYAATEVLLGSRSTTLRTLDALHLATALESVILSGLAKEELVLVTADHHLIDAAAAAGVRVENPEDHP